MIKSIGQANACYSCAQQVVKSSVQTPSEPDSDLAGITLNANDIPAFGAVQDAPANPNLDFLDSLTPGAQASTQNFYINGIRTEAEAAEFQACRISQHLNDEVKLIYNPTEGFLADGIEALQNLTGFKTDIALQARDAFKVALDQGQKLRIFSHSQGAAITADALRRLEKSYLQDGLNPEIVAEKMSHIEVVGFGGFATENDYPEGVQVALYNKKDDPIPQFAKEYDGLKTSFSQLGAAFSTEESDIMNKFGASVMALGSTGYTLGKFVFRNMQQAVGAAAGKTVNIVRNEGIEGLGKINWADFGHSVSTTVQSDHLAVVKEDFTRTYVTPGYIDEFKAHYAKEKYA